MSSPVVVTIYSNIPLDSIMNVQTQSCSIRADHDVFVGQSRATVCPLYSTRTGAYLFPLHVLVLLTVPVNIVVLYSTCSTYLNISTITYVENTKSHFFLLHAIEATKHRQIIFMEISILL